MFFRKKQKQLRLKNRAKRIIMQERSDVEYANALRQLSSLKPQANRVTTR